MHEFMDEFFANFVHEFKYEIRMNFLHEKLVMLRMACTVGKLEHYGIRRIANVWLKSCLKNRYQKAKIGSTV